MNETWWLDPSQLDDTQRSILREPPETEMLIIGPPGSGKTNILVLRANYVRSVLPSLAFLTFTRTLTEFLRSGRNVGRGDQIQPGEITTFMAFSRTIIRQQGGDPPPVTGDFEFDRAANIRVLSEIMNEENTGTLFDVIFVDEVQQFSQAELDLVRRLSRHINASGDNRQRITDHREGIRTISAMLPHQLELTEHYRIGEAICGYADQIMPPKLGEAALLDGCNYPERERPSSVNSVSCSDEDSEIERCIEIIRQQRRYITDEPIGVLSPNGHLRDVFWDSISRDAELAPISIRQRQEEYQPFGPDSLVRVMTTHSAQGSEFRAVHMLGGELYGKRRELAFTAATRAKTELTVYHIDPLPGHLIPPKRDPPSDLATLF